MKQGADWLISQRNAPDEQYFFGHLYGFTLASGAQDFFTDLDMDVVWGGNTWKSDSLRIEGMRSRMSVGTRIDEQTVRIGATPVDTLAGAAFLANVGQGLLDGAYLSRYRAFWPLVTGCAYLDAQQPPASVIQLSVMRASMIVKAGRNGVEMKWKSPLVLLNQTMPRNYYQPTCLWALYSAGCTMVKTNFAINLVVESTVAPNGIYPLNGISFGYSNGVQGATDGHSADGNATFANGQILFTSGVLKNLSVLVSTNSDLDFLLTYPLMTMPNVGDTFTAYAGCMKLVSSCGLKFGIGASDPTYDAVTGISNQSGNLANMRNFDLVPSEHIGL